MIPELMNCAHDPEGWCLDCLKTMICRAEVADALEELRVEWQHQLHCYTTRNEEEIYFERQCELEIRLGELDATITKLGLAPGKEGK